MQVRTVPVITQQVDLSELAVTEVKVQEIRTVEASLRVDAIASAGFRTSRAKIADLVKAGEVRSVHRWFASSTGLAQMIWPN